MFLILHRATSWRGDHFAVKMAAISQPRWPI